MGPGWVNERSAWWMVMVDPFDFVGLVVPKSERERFWETPERWAVAEGGSFAEGMASNVRGKGMGKGEVVGRGEGEDEKGGVV